MEICKEMFLSRCLCAAICIAALVMLTGTAYAAEKQEETKTLHKMKTENGVSVRIVGSRGGRERVLMDCEYDAAEFPYYFDKYAAFGGNDDIFYQFYMDKFVWEKTIHANKPDRTYTLYYAQNAQYDSEDEEKAAGYEGHLWVLDEETRIVKRLFWRSDAPYIKIVWKKNGLSIQYADGSKRTCTLPELLQDPAEAVCERCMQIDFTVQEYAIDTEKCDAATDRAYRDAYDRALNGGQRVRTEKEGEVYLKELWAYQGDSEMEDGTFLNHLIENAKFYYMDFDGDGLPELVLDMIGDGLHILKYLPGEDVVEHFFGYERVPYLHLLGSGQLYYENGMLANKSIRRYHTVDAGGRDKQVVCFMEDADYKPHREDEDVWWDTAYWVDLYDELGMVQVDEKGYRDVTKPFLEAVECAVTAKTYEEIFGDRKAEVAKKRREIPIDFPFYGEEKEHRLVLAAPEDGQNAYELLYYDEDGKILQQIFCGKLEEPVTFSFDGLAYASWYDLELFSAGSDTGLLFIWKDGRFSTTPIGIPRYEKCSGSAMLTVTEDEEVCEKELYLLNEDRNRTEKARSYTLHKDTAELTIWDEIEKRYLFEGTARLDENGNPMNEKYFDTLLWGNRPILFDYREEEPVHVWVGEGPKPREERESVEIDSYEDMTDVEYNSWHMEEYESQEAFLANFGFEDSEPVYQYFDQNGNLGLELYMDEDREQVCGLVYTNRTDSDLEKVAEINGFTLGFIPEAKWNGIDPFAFQSVYGTTGEEQECIKDYEESVAYNAFGKPDCFVSRGRVEGWSAEDMMQDILRIEFVYREDGTLYYRHYYHTHQAFGTTLQGLDSYYDAHGRVVFESGYITHGWLEYYYIYEDGNGRIADQPAYVLEIDHNMGCPFPKMIRCL